MTVGVTRDNVAIVLQRPRYPENIGSAARAMANMGFARLVVVNPGIWDEERIRRLATHAAGSVVDGMLAVRIRDNGGADAGTIGLGMGRLRRVIREYFAIFIKQAGV